MSAPYDEPAWLNDAVKIAFADAMIAFLAKGGMIKLGELSFSEAITSDEIAAVLFPDGEHHIGAWIVQLRDEDRGRR